MKRYYVIMWYAKLVGWFIKDLRKGIRYAIDEAQYTLACDIEATQHYDESITIS